MTHAIWPQATWRHKAVLVVLGSLLTAAVTGQTFAVLLVGALLGSRAGAAAMLTYLAEGAAGLPVFAGGKGGLAVLAGPTAGYLFGFVAAAFVVGWLCERGWDRRVWTAASFTFLAYPGWHDSSASKTYWRWACCPSFPATFSSWYWRHWRCHLAGRSWG